MMNNNQDKRHDSATIADTNDNTKWHEKNVKQFQSYDK